MWPLVEAPPPPPAWGPGSPRPLPQDGSEWDKKQGHAGHIPIAGGSISVEMVHLVKEGNGPFPELGRHMRFTEH